MGGGVESLKLGMEATEVERQGNNWPRLVVRRTVEIFNVVMSSNPTSSLAQTAPLQSPIRKYVDFELLSQPLSHLLF